MWGEICIQIGILAQSPQAPGEGFFFFLVCLEVVGMELLGMWDLGYLAWTKATDLTKHGEFFSVYLGRIISLLFGHIHV